MVSYERETPVKPLNPEACSRVCSPPPSLADCTSPPLPQQLFVFHACLGFRPVVNLVKALSKVMEYFVLGCTALKPLQQLQGLTCSTHACCGTWGGLQSARGGGAGLDVTLSWSVQVTAFDEWRAGEREGGRESERARDRQRD